jgi:hypothetical protein
MLEDGKKLFFQDFQSLTVYRYAGAHGYCQSVRTSANAIFQSSTQAKPQ